MVLLTKLMIVKNKNDSYMKIAKVVLKESGFCEVYVDERKYAVYASLEDCLNGEDFVEKDSFLCTSQREVNIGKYFLAIDGVRKRVLN